MRLWPHTHTMKGLRKWVLLAWGKIFDFPPRGKITPKLAISLGCYRIQKPLKPGNTKKIRKNYKSPISGLAPKIRKKYQKLQKWSFSGQFCNFSVFFSHFWSQTGNGWFVIFSYFQAWGVFVFCSTPGRLQPQASFCFKRSNLFSQTLFWGAPMNSHRLDRLSARQAEHIHGTYLYTSTGETQSQCDVSRQNSLCRTFSWSITRECVKDGGLVYLPRNHLF